MSHPEHLAERVGSPQTHADRSTLSGVAEQARDPACLATSNAARQIRAGEVAAAALAVAALAVALHPDLQHTAQLEPGIARPRRRRAERLADELCRRSGLNL